MNIIFENHVIKIQNSKDAPGQNATNTFGILSKLSSALMFRCIDLKFAKNAKTTTCSSFTVPAAAFYDKCTIYCLMT